MRRSLLYIHPALSLLCAAFTPVSIVTTSLVSLAVKGSPADVSRNRHLPAADVVLSVLASLHPPPLPPAAPAPRSLPALSMAPVRGQPGVSRADSGAAEEAADAGVTVNLNSPGGSDATCYTWELWVGVGPEEPKPGAAAIGQAPSPEACRTQRPPRTLSALHSPLPQPHERLMTTPERVNVFSHLSLLVWRAGST